MIIDYYLIKDSPDFSLICHIRTIDIRFGYRMYVVYESSLSSEFLYFFFLLFLMSKLIVFLVLGIIAFANQISIQVGNAPSAIIFHEYIYVANYNSSTVSVIDPSTNSVISTIQVGSNPISLVYADGYIFVADFGSNQISVIRDNEVIKNITDLVSPYSLAYDNRTNEIFVSESFLHKIAVINVNNLSVVRSLEVSFFPGAMAYDYYNDKLYVAELPLIYVGSVYVIDPNTGKIINSYNIGGKPVSISYYDGNIYVTSWYNNKLTIINSTGLYQFNAGLGPYYALYDPNDGYIYVSDVATNSIIVMTSSGNIVKNISVGERPSYMVYVNGKIYVSSTLSNAVYVIPQVPPPSPPFEFYLFIGIVVIIVILVGFFSIKRQLSK